MGWSDAYVSPHYRARRTLAQEGIHVEPDESVKVRLIKVDLPDGNIEVLMTTLLDKRRYSRRHFGKIYEARWSVETAIFCVKSFGQLTAMSSYKPGGIEQDIWAQYALYNLQTMLIRDRQKEVKKINQHRKYNYAINRNVTLGLIKRNLPLLFLEPLRKWRAKVTVLLKLMVQYLEPKRPRPSRPRNRKIMRGQGRHIYQSNYRPTH